VPAATVKLDDVVVSTGVVVEKLSVCAPVPVTVRFVNVATPFTAATLTVPLNTPLPLATLAVTVAALADRRGSATDAARLYVETEASLAAAQGASFRLATVSFKGLANGLSLLTLSNVVLSNWDGSATLREVGARNGEICVGGNCAVPEPATLLLIGSALGGAAGGLVAAARDERSVVQHDGRFARAIRALVAVRGDVAAARSKVRGEDFHVVAAARDDRQARYCNRAPRRDHGGAALLPGP